MSVDTRDDRSQSTGNTQKPYASGNPGSGASNPNGQPGTPGKPGQPGQTDNKNNPKPNKASSDNESDQAGGSRAATGRPADEQARR